MNNQKPIIPDHAMILFKVTLGWVVCEKVEYPALARIFH